MPNTMDDIVMEYGVQIDRDSYVSLSDGEAYEKHQQALSQIKKCRLPEFLKLDPKDLSEKERLVQEGLLFIYQENEKDPPLFHSFPDRGKNRPLTIDCTSFPKEEKGSAIAEFRKDLNKIRFKKSEAEMDIVMTLAHELKHAEQCSSENEKIREGADGLAIHQVRFLGEAQAYAFGLYLQYLQFQHLPIKEVRKKILADGDMLTPVLWPVLEKEVSPSFAGGLLGNLFNKKNPKTIKYSEIEAKLIAAALPELYSSSYKETYDSCNFIKMDDKGLETIPESFHLSPHDIEKVIMPLLKKVPYKAKDQAARMLQLVSEGKMIESRKVALQQDEKGAYIISSWKRSSYLDSFKLPDEAELVAELLKEKDKTGKGFISDWERSSFIKKKVLSLDEKDFAKCMHIFRDGKEPALSQKETDDLFDSLIMGLRFGHKEDREKFHLSPEESPQTKEEMDHFMIRHEKPIELLLKHTLVSAEIIGNKLESVIEYGSYEGTQKMIEYLMRQDNENALSFVRSAFQGIAGNYFARKVDEEQLPLLAGRTRKILHSFLELKEPNEQFVITSKDIDKLIKDIAMRKWMDSYSKLPSKADGRGSYPMVPVVEVVLDKYKADHPDDVRFKSQQKNEEPTNGKKPTLMARRMNQTSKSVSNSSVEQRKSPVQTDSGR